MSLLPRTTLHSDSEQYILWKSQKVNIFLYLLYTFNKVETIFIVGDSFWWLVAVNKSSLSPHETKNPTFLEQILLVNTLQS